MTREHRAVNALATAMLEFLRREGYRPDVAPDGDIRFHYRDLNCYVTLDPRDALYLRVAVPNIWSIDDEQERREASEVAARVQWNLKAVKVTLTDNDDTWVTVEVFLPSEDAWRSVFSRALASVHTGVQRFWQEMDERRGAHRNLLTALEPDEA